MTGNLDYIKDNLLFLLDIQPILFNQVLLIHQNKQQTNTIDLLSLQTYM